MMNRTNASLEVWLQSLNGSGALRTEVWLPNDADVPLDDMNWLFLAPRERIFLLYGDIQRIST